MSDVCSLRLLVITFCMKVWYMYLNSINCDVDICNLNGL